VKIAKSLIGRRVSISWRDPCNFRNKGKHAVDVPPIRTSLPLWEECGWIHSVSDGIVKLQHARCVTRDEDNWEDEGSEVFEDLIETLEVWPEVKEANGV